jgi:PAS domain S-box-containing protein
MKKLLDGIKEIRDGNYDYGFSSLEYEEFINIGKNIELLAKRIRQRERELKLSENKFKGLTESAPLGILIYQGENFVYCNRASEFISGYTKKEILSMKFWDIAYTPYREIIRQRGILRQKGEKGLPDRYEFEILRKDGERRWVDFAVTLIEYMGKPAGMVIVEDITEKKKVIEEVKSLRNLLLNIINSMPSSLVTVDKNFKIIYWNKIMERTFGIKELEKDFRYKPIFEVLSLDEEIIEKLKMAIHQKRTESVLKKRISLSGEELYENITIFPILSNGTEGAVIRIDDITQQIKFQEMIIHSDKMITIGSMASGIAHEINNPLAIIV